MEPPGTGRSAFRALRTLSSNALFSTRAPRWPCWGARRGRGRVCNVSPILRCHNVGDGQRPRKPKSDLFVHVRSQFPTRYPQLIHTSRPGPLPAGWLVPDPSMERGIERACACRSVPSRRLKMGEGGTTPPARRAATSRNRPAYPPKRYRWTIQRAEVCCEWVFKKRGAKNQRNSQASVSLFPLASPFPPQRFRFPMIPVW